MKMYIYSLYDLANFHVTFHVSSLTNVKIGSISCE